MKVDEKTVFENVFDEKNEATYCPDDDKLRLCVGRVPREQYLALKAQGWTSTPKQKCDFVAAWTPGREDVALAYAGIIGDEDQSPEERAADRAERFIGYRDKRTEEAGILADAWDDAGTITAAGNRAGSVDRAERQANRLDRTRIKAVNQWEKAEYWQERTQGVISHALHKQSASVRRGRILELEAELRKYEKALAELIARWKQWKLAEKMLLDPEKEQKAREYIDYLVNYCSRSWDYQHPRKPEKARTSLYSLLTDTDPITPDEAVKLYLSRYPETGPAETTRTQDHLRFVSLMKIKCLKRREGKRQTLK